MNCSVQTCEQSAATRGYCKSHYAKVLRYGAPLFQRVYRRTTCSVCGDPAHGNELCVKHYTRARRHDGETELPTEEDRFWSFVARGAEHECWEWGGGRDPDGYGIFSIAGKSKRANRFALETVTGPLGPGLFACHRCDNPPCCNTAHLFAGTAQINVKDAVAKQRHGRMRKGTQAMDRTPVIQGDVLLMPVEAIPQGDVQQPDARRRGHVLAEGEVTGHAHVLDRATLTVADGVRYVDVEAGAALRHEDHGTVVVPAGAYRVLQQTEPDLATGVQRNVAD